MLPCDTHRASSIPASLQTTEAGVNSAGARRSHNECLNWHLSSHSPEASERARGLTSIQPNHNPTNPPQALRPPSRPLLAIPRSPITQQVSIHPRLEQEEVDEQYGEGQSGVDVGEIAALGRALEEGCVGRIGVGNVCGEVRVRAGQRGVRRQRRC